MKGEMSMTSFRKSILLSLMLCVAISPVFAQGIFDSTADWDRADGTKVAGSVSYSGGTYTIEGNGDDIWNETDEGFYVYTEKSGSWSLSGKFTWVVTGGNDWAKMGPMIREGGDVANAMNYAALARGLGDLVSPQWRDAVGMAASSQSERIRDENGDLVPLVDGSIWLRVTRIAEEDYFYCEWSYDGSTWAVGNSHYLPMADSVAYGLTITNHDANDVLAMADVENVALSEFDQTLAIRSFDSVDIKDGQSIGVSLRVVNAAAGTVTETLPEGWSASDVSDNGVASGNTVTWTITDASTDLSYTANMTAGSESSTFTGNIDGFTTLGSRSVPIILPADLGIFEWEADINVSAAGSAEFDGGYYIVTGSGADVWGTSDGFHFVYKEVSGPIRLEGNVLNFVDDGDATWAKTGFMIRQDTSASAVNGFIGVRSDLAAFRQIRPAPGAESSSGDNPTGQDGTLAIERVGNTFNYYYKDLNGDWVSWGSMVAEELNDPVLVGLAVTSHSNGNLTSAEYTDVTLTVYDGYATRSLPTKVLKSDSTTIEGVNVSAVITEGKTSSATVTEVLPAGFSATNIQTTNGSASASGSTITWSLSGAEGTVEMTYDLVVGNTDEPALFSGNLGGLTTGGDSGIFPIMFTAPYTPEANVTMDGLISDGEYAGGYSETFDATDAVAPGTLISGTPFSAAENNLTFHVVHNNEYIWIGMDVVDPSLGFNENETEVWNNDSIEFNFDGNISRMTTKEGNRLGFQTSVVGNGRIVGGNNAPTVIQAADYAYSTDGAYWNFATRVKADNSGWVTELQLDKSQVLDPPSNTIVGFDIKVNGTDAGAGARNLTWGYWYTDVNGTVDDAFWDNETGWAIVDLQRGYEEAGVVDWSLF
jgi:hypothetical protein